MVQDAPSDEDSDDGEPPPLLNRDHVRYDSSSDDDSDNEGPPALFSERDAWNRLNGHPHGEGPDVDFDDGRPPELIQSLLDEHSSSDEDSSDDEPPPLNNGHYPDESSSDEESDDEHGEYERNWPTDFRRGDW